jgi:DeoR family transcriptional regulator, suf operon transcriptional repressor
MFPMDPRIETGSAAERIIAAVTRGGQTTISDLVAALGVTTTAVRQQVNRLLADGWLVRSQRHGGMGRPADVFSVSEQAQRLFGERKGEFSRLLLEEMAQTIGAARRRAMLRNVGRRMAEQRRRFVGEGSPAQRLQSLAELLGREGVLAETSGPQGDLHLAVFTCPYHGLAAEHREICEMERQTFSDLVGGDVRRHQCVLDGHGCCEFSLTPVVRAGASRRRPSGSPHRRA